MLEAIVTVVDQATITADERYVVEGQTVGRTANPNPDATMDQGPISDFGSYLLLLEDEQPRRDERIVCGHDAR